MEQGKPRSRISGTTTVRKPLADATSRANSATPPSHQIIGAKAKALSDETIGNGAQRLKEKVISDVGATGDTGNSSTKAHPLENKRISAIADDARPASNRNSVASTMSSNASGPLAMRRKSQIGPWQLGKTIGHGGSSTVREVRHTTTGQCGAAKIISKRDAEMERAQSLANLINSAKTDPSLMDNGKVIPFGLEREIIIMKLLEHRNIVRLYDVWENRNQLYLVMEYVRGGELYHYIQEQEGLDEINIVYLFRQIIAALLHCHRLNIHHRDLKLENILLDRETFQIKLADFGMAAMQPFGRFLNTHCGSPQYAAPELYSSRPYDGGQADVWNCGIILYMMLTGRPPFPYSGHTRDMAKLIKLATARRYHMPSELSPEAKDLIRRILVPQPHLRITMQNIWRHPFLHKYDKDFAFNQENSRMEYWIGPEPQIDNWKPLTRETIDRHIMRNLRTLWHSEREDTLVDRLLSDEYNQEKYFYMALSRFEEEHLENYYGDSEAIGYSRSDRQHGRLAGERTTLPRTKSQFSILNDEHLTSKDIPDLPSTSSGGRNPSRANSNQNRSSSNSKCNGAVYRPGSSGSHRRAPSSIAVSRRTGSLRKEALRRKSRRSSIASASSMVPQDHFTERRSDGGGCGTNSNLTSSPMTKTSSAFPSSPPCSIRPRNRNSYKRNVSFKHARKSSTSSGPNNPIVSTVPQQPNVSRITTARRRQTAVADHDSIQSSPPLMKVPQTIGRKEVALATKQVARPRHARNSSQYIKHEARKVSDDLERACEEAFNRSSVASSVQTAVTEKPNVYDTPPSSVSYRESHLGNDGASRKIFERANPNAYVDRPLPALPDETPRTFVARELEETRRRLAERYREEDLSNIPGCKDLLMQLNNLLKPALAKAGGIENDHAALLPGANSLYSPLSLPVISEDHNLSTRPGISGSQAGCNEAADNTDEKPRYWANEQHAVQDTIRMINSSRSPSPVMPLNIRKASSATTQIQAKKDTLPTRGGVFRSDADIFGISGLYAHDELRPVPPVPLNNDSTPGRTNEQLEKKESIKRRGWLRWKHKREEGNERKEKSPYKSYVEQSDDNERRDCPISPRQTGKLQKRLSEFPPAQNVRTSTEFPMRHRNVSSEKKGLLKFFAKLGEHKVGRNMQDTSFEFSDSSSVGSSALTALPQSLSDGLGTSKSRSVETQQNWLARVLHIKPASRLLCFQVGRGRVRQEIVRTLREWRKHGVRDVSFDRKTNLIAARVDKTNFLKIRGVHFTAELFAVLQHGRRANLCMARFTQTRGAASSFQKVVETLQMVLAAKGLLIEDEETKNEMCEMLG